MIARLRHALRMGIGLVAVGLLTACGREATRPIATLPAQRPSAAPALPAPRVPIRADLTDAVYFDYKRHSLRPGALRAIDDWIAFLKVHDGLVVSLTGHTDASGTKADNFALGERRAAAVRRALVRGGIATERIRVRSRGEEQPQVYGRDEFAASRNRRVEFEILK